MAIEEALKTYLEADATVGGLVSTRVWPMKLKDGWTLPAITYQRISGPRTHDTNGPTGRATPRFQVDCWADSYSGVRALAVAVRARLDGAKGTIGGEANVGGIYIDSERDIYEDEIKVYRVSMDFMVPHDES